MEPLDINRLGPSKTVGGRYELRFCCPNCGDKGYKLYVNLKKHVYHCFRCGFKGRVKETKHFHPIEPSKLNNEAPRPVKQGSGGRLPLQGPSDGQKECESYWKERGFTLDDANHYGVLANPFGKALSISIFDENGVFQFYQERKLWVKSGMKYVFPSGTEKSKFLFNSHRAFNKTRVCLVEGVMDAMAIGDHGLCIFGKELSNFQIEILRRSKVQEILVWLDPDARAKAFEAQDRLLPFFDVSMVVCDDQTLKDANDYLVKHGSDKLLTMLGLPGKGY